MKHLKKKKDINRNIKEVGNESRVSLWATPEILLYIFARNKSTDLYCG